MKCHKRGWLRNARETRDLSLQKAAESVEANVRSWHRWENGETRPDDTTRAKIAKLYPETRDHWLAEEAALLTPPQAQAS